jgi:hypothetical protein
LTDRQAEALALWDPSPRGAGIRSVALALDCSRSAARDCIQAGLQKIERAMREPAVEVSVRAPEKPPKPRRARARTSEPGIQVFVD